MAAGRNRAVILAASHSGRLPLFPAVTEGQARASGDKERPTIKSQVDNRKNKRNYHRKKEYNNKTCCQAGWKGKRI